MSTYHSSEMMLLTDIVIVKIRVRISHDWVIVLPVEYKGVWRAWDFLLFLTLLGKRGFFVGVTSVDVAFRIDNRSDDMLGYIRCSRVFRTLRKTNASHSVVDECDAMIAKEITDMM